MLELNDFKDLIRAGAAQIPADLVIKNGQLVNVSTKEIYPTEVAIYKNKIVAVDEDVSDYIGENTKIIDAKQKYLVPGMIDGHIHVECSKLSMTSFAKAVVPHGTTSIISGLDEYISVIGLKGLPEIFKEIDNSNLKLFWGAPFKTPYTIPQSTIAENIDSDVQRELLKQSNVYGVWETVREDIQELDEDTLKTMLYAKAAHKPVWGCSPMARGKKLNQYLMSGVRVDHESYDHEELLEKARKGLNVVVRESSVTHFLKENIRAITENNADVASHVSFCTDDVTATDIAELGHLDHVVRLAIKSGVDPLTAIQMATINSAQAYRIDDQVGIIAPGREADILFVKNLDKFKISKVISKGKIVDEKKVPDVKRSPEIMNSVKASEVSANDFVYKVDIKNGTADVETIKSVGPFVRKRRDVKLEVKDHIIQIDTNKDVALVSVIERFGINGNKSLGFTSGWGLKAGAMASSASPDDNNLIVMGVNNIDMAFAANELIKRGGGQIVVKDEKVLSFLPLPIAGIVSEATPEELVSQEKSILKAARSLGSMVDDPMFYMTFLPITAIPDLAITDLGPTDCIALKIFDPILNTEVSK
ncbi:amidohydrolase family protein [Companilactobacillus allii]|uniref:Adenine deaminase n=1 Tax=Companilactobacillus allii TaxID=1847728 RepID=A0A1P8Q3J4_9LACO|nr:adenine deaminase C-terminal domain-containing protein [Companilactobacillus allii]APX72397.1 adenosine deaminase [Companilactobacillus allii]USQ69489.1 amidohydrolase family protein [Companilactobacillus allii]